MLSRTLFGISMVVITGLSSPAHAYKHRMEIRNAVVKNVSCDYQVVTIARDGEPDELYLQNLKPMTVEGSLFFAAQDAISKSPISSGVMEISVNSAANVELSGPFVILREEKTRPNGADGQVLYYVRPQEVRNELIQDRINSCRELVALMQSGQPSPKPLPILRTQNVLVIETPVGAGASAGVQRVFDDTKLTVDMPQSDAVKALMRQKAYCVSKLDQFAYPTSTLKGQKPVVGKYCNQLN